MTCLKKFSVVFATVGLVLVVADTVKVETVEPTPVPVESVIVEDHPSFHIEAEEVIHPRVECPLDDDTQQMILDKSEHFGIDFAFTMAVIHCESSFNPNADSGSSVGLMQINRINHQWLSEEIGATDFWDPEQNVTAGLYILRDLFEKYHDPALVLMAYNMGESGAKNLWDKEIYTSDYAEKVLQQAEIYNDQIEERMGENGQM